VIYEIHVGLYGGFAAVEACLPDLCELGVTAIELMRWAPFGHPQLGLRRRTAVRTASVVWIARRAQKPDRSGPRAGLMVFVDVVYNHFGPEGNYLATTPAPSFVRI